MSTAPDSPDATRIPGYALLAPTEADARAALDRVWGADRSRQAWVRACREAGISVGHVDSLDRLGKVTAALATQGGATATVARSIEIRIRTFLRLASRAAATGAAR